MYKLALLLFLLVSNTGADLTPSQMDSQEVGVGVEQSLMVTAMEESPSLDSTGELVNDSATGMKRDVEVVCVIADGCTNSGTALTNGRLIYSASGAIVEAPYLKSYDGRSLTIADPAATGASIISPVKLNIVGADGSTSAGPHMQFYTNADNYTLLQCLSFAHDNIVIAFDNYWNSAAWKSSYSGSNYQIYKQSNQLQFRYGSGVAQGSTVTLYNAFYIDTSGKTTFVQPIKLPSSGGTASDFNYYSESSVTCGVYTDTASSYSDTSASVSATRVGNKVTVMISGVTGTISTAAGFIYINGTNLASAFRPSAAQDWVVVVQDAGSTYTGYISWDSTNTRFMVRNNVYGTFSVGSPRGLYNTAGFSYLK